MDDATQAPAAPNPTLEALRRENQALKHAVHLLHEVSRLVHGALEFEATCYAVLTGVTAGVGLGFNRAMLFLPSREDRGLLEGLMAVGPTDRDEADRVWKALEQHTHDLSTLHGATLATPAASPIDAQVRATRVALDGTSVIARALKERRVIHAAPGTDDLGGLVDLATGLATPLCGAEGVVGVLYADNRFTGQRSDPVLDHVFSLVGDQAARAVENARRFEREALAARTDALTGLGHHGTLMEDLGAAVKGAQASGERLAVVMLDLDDFKQVNDRHGHLAGDALLAGLSSRLRSTLRAGERAYRYGGEEFAVILKGVDQARARATAERLRQAIAHEPFAASAGLALHITCSVGVAVLGPEMGVHELVDAADQALLLAKRQGKNRVVG